MASWITVHAAPLVATAALLMLMYVVFARESANHRQRLANLLASKELLAKHLVLVEGLVADERVNEALKSKILAFSGAIVDDETFLEIWTAACKMIDDRGARELSSYQRDLASLFAISAELATDLENAVSTALHGMLLRLPEAQEELFEWYAKVATDSDSQRFMFLRAIEKGRRARGVDIDIGAIPAGA